MSEQQRGQTTKPHHRGSAPTTARVGRGEGGGARLAWSAGPGPRHVAATSQVQWGETPQNALYCSRREQPRAAGDLPTHRPRRHTGPNPGPPTQQQSPATARLLLWHPLAVQLPLHSHTLQVPPPTRIPPALPAPPPKPRT